MIAVLIVAVVGYVNHQRLIQPEIYNALWRHADLSTPRGNFAPSPGSRARGCSNSRPFAAPRDRA
jgi:hypothetical protein